MIVLDLDIVPVPKGRPRACLQKGHPAIYTPPVTRKYEAAVKERAKVAMAGAQPLDGPLRVRLEFRLPIPAYADQKRRRLQAEAGISWPIGSRMGDADNLAKAVLDSCNGVIWKDDAQIVDLGAVKRWGLKPGVTMTVETA